MNQKEFKRKAKSSLIEKHGLIWFRGGVLGMIHLSFFDSLVQFLEKNRQELVRKQDKYATNKEGGFDKEKMLQSKKEDIKRFIFSVDDDAYILRQLYYLGYFDEMQGQDYAQLYQQSQDSVQKPVYQSINLLIASIATGLLLGVVLTPIDLIAYRLKTE